MISTVNSWACIVLLWWCRCVLFSLSIKDKEKEQKPNDNQHLIVEHKKTTKNNNKENKTKKVNKTFLEKKIRWKAQVLWKSANHEWLRGNMIITFDHVVINVVFDNNSLQLKLSLIIICCMKSKLTDVLTI